MLSSSLCLGVHSAKQLLFLAENKQKRIPLQPQRDRDNMVAAFITMSGVRAGDTPHRMMSVTSNICKAALKVIQPPPSGHRCLGELIVASPMATRPYQNRASERRGFSPAAPTP